MKRGIFAEYGFELPLVVSEWADQGGGVGFHSHMLR